MLEIFNGIMIESYILLTKMSIYLLFGFLFAGILHIFLSPKTIAKHLGKNSYGSVLKASLFGIPLPLCSCGVIPAAMSLRKEGASQGAVLSFLISTPTTGIDSIFATYALLGGVFTIFRISASFIAAFLVGVMANLLTHDKPKKQEISNTDKCKLCSEPIGTNNSHKHTLTEHIKGVFKYAFETLMDDAGDWLTIGIILGGIISYLVPDTLINQYIGTNIRSIIIMLLIGMPMYVCASGSIPIAAALMLKGLNPGAAFAFLMAGPSTNTVTMTVIYKNLGKKSLFIYLVSIISSSIFLGLLLNKIWDYLKLGLPSEIIKNTMLFPAWAEHISATLLICMIIYNKIKPTHH